VKTMHVPPQVDVRTEDRGIAIGKTARTSSRQRSWPRGSTISPMSRFLQKTGEEEPAVQPAENQ